MMATHQLLQHLDVDHDRSPACKRARFDLDLRDLNRWTLTKNELILHSEYDSGVDRLESDSENDSTPEVPKKRKKKLYVEKQAVKREEIAILEASLPENTLQQLSLREFDNHLLANTSDPLTNNNTNYFSYLSDEMILQIFKNLSKGELADVSLVCRRFSQLAEDESLWTHMDVSNQSIGKGGVGKIMSRQVIILRLSKSRIKYPPILPKARAALSTYQSRLMYLDLTMASISPRSLVMILGRCKRLKKISLESVLINNDVLYTLSRNRDLEIINLAMAAGVEIEGLRRLLENCKKIKELNLSWTYLNLQCIEHVCKSLPPTLDRLNLSGCRKLLQDDNVSQLVKKCCHLRELDLSDCTSITGDSVRQITALEQLNFLALSRCYAVPYRSLLFLKDLKSLRYLDVHGTYVDEGELRIVQEGLGMDVSINKFKFSSIARPAVGMKKWVVWGMKLRA